MNPLNWWYSLWKSDCYETGSCYIEQAPPNENKLNTYMLNRKHYLIGKNSIVTCLSYEQTYKTQYRFEWNDELFDELLS